MAGEFFDQEDSERNIPVGKFFPSGIGMISAQTFWVGRGEVGLWVRDRSGNPARNFSVAKAAIKEVGGWRFLVDILTSQDTQSAELMREVSLAYRAYYKKLLIYERSRGLDFEKWYESFLPVMNKVAELGEIFINTERNLRGIVIFMAGQYEARREIFEELTSLADREYLANVASFLEVLRSEVEHFAEFAKGYGEGCLENQVFTRSFLYEAWQESWKLKLSRSCLYHDRYAFDRYDMQRIFRLSMEREAGSVGLEPGQYSLTTIFVPGGGVGRTSTIRILSGVDAILADKKVWMDEGHDVWTALHPSRREILLKEEELRTELARTMDSSVRFQLEELLRYKLVLYMGLRLVPIDILIDRFKDFLWKLPLEQRGHVNGYIDTMGLAVLSSIFARMLVNDLLTPNKDLKRSLQYDAVVKVPEDSRLQIEMFLVDTYAYLLEYVLGKANHTICKTGGLTVVLDIPTFKAVERSGRDEALRELRARQNADREALRLLGLIWREIFPDEIAVVHCGVEDKQTGQIRYLSKIKVACACDIDRTSLRIRRNAFQVSPFVPKIVTQELGVLLKRVKVMQKDLSSLLEI